MPYERSENMVLKHLLAALSDFTDKQLVFFFPTQYKEGSKQKQKKQEVERKHLFEHIYHSMHSPSLSFGFNVSLCLL